jgi:hypothetical protein
MHVPLTTPVASSIMDSTNPQGTSAVQHPTIAQTAAPPKAQRLLAAALCVLLCTCCLGRATPSADRTEKQLGETAELVGWRVTVLSVTALPEDPYRQSPDGHMFVAVELRLENDSQRLRYVMPERQMTLLDGAGHAYTPNRKAAVIAARALQWLIPEGEFLPGAVAEGATSYQVPLSARNLRWVFRAALRPGAPTLTFALGDAPRP